MNRDEIKKILGQFKKNRISIEGVMEKLAQMPYVDIEVAKIDTHRSVRKGFPEVVYGANKSLESIVKILKVMKMSKATALITKLHRGKFRKLDEMYPGLIYHEDAKIAVLKGGELKVRGRGTILVLAAGTSDVPIAQEAYWTANYMGNRVEKLYDVGVAGIHRLLDKVTLIRKASVIIVVAGMEGALASVVGGLTAKPVIGVPTSIGYGTSFKGLTALLGMLNTCSPGVVTVNIDNGFGAGYFASLINQK